MNARPANHASVNCTSAHLKARLGAKASKNYSLVNDDLLSSKW